MFWELIATAVAGVGAAGIALAGRHLTAKRLPRWTLPRWTVPVFAGLGMLGFQIYSEYHWFQHQTGLLPKDVAVVKSVQERTAWRPWSLLFPQTVRFMAMNPNEATRNEENPALVLANIYVFERRLPVRRIPLVLHCAKNARAVLSETLQVPDAGEALSDQWHRLADDDPMLAVVCQNS